MASQFNDPQSCVSPQVQRFGAYPYQPAPVRESPTPPVDEYALFVRQQDALLQSTPRCQFFNQWMREKKELFKPDWKKMRNLPFDRRLDLHSNAKNNVRSRWVEQGIWKSKWGPAWPRGLDLSNWPLWVGPEPDGDWGHEEGPQREPTPEPELARSPEDNRRPLSDFLREQLKAYAKRSAIDSKRDITEEPATASERDTSASRPYYQFLYQVSKECGWIKDELQHQGSAGSVDIEAKAYENVKKIWVEDQIWNDKWGELPGMT